MTRCLLLFIITIALNAAHAAESGDAPLPATIDFNRDIRPILSDNCFYCHGPDKNTREADLRLDTKEGLLSDLGDYSPAVPGKPLESEIVKRITAGDPDDLMPPPDSGKSLTPRQVALVRKWIEQGVDFKGHWLYIPPKRPSPPAMDDPAFVKNDIDRFVLGRLKAEGLKPSPEADRVTLIRRLSFDLTGLPPTSEQVEAFVNDTRPDAYKRLVDGLLASPHYGERMAMHWLDLVRFADTVGYHGDRPMNIYPYRDYVIQAFNENTPFDRFTAEQLGGDLMPNAALQQKVASGYNRLNMMTEEGGAQDKEYLAKYASDRVRNVSAVWLGSTLGCAECHDHKFDPFAAKDFYRMAAFFADIKEVGYYGGLNNSGNWGEHIQVATPEQQQQKQRLAAALDEARRALAVETPELAAAQAEWESVVRSKEWVPLQLVTASSEQGTTLKLLDDGSILAADEAGSTDTYTLTFSTDLKGITALRLEVLPDPSLPGQGPGRSLTGNFFLNDFEARINATTLQLIDPTINGTKLQLVEPTATFSQEGYAIAGASDDNPQTSWAIAPQMGKPHSAVFQIAQAAQVVEGTGPTTLTVQMRQLVGNQHVIGRFRITANKGPRPIVAGEVDDAIAAIVKIDPAQRTAEQRAAVAAQFRAVTPLLTDARAKIAVLEQQYNQFNATIPTTLVTVARDEPRVTRILPRGNWMDETGEVVEPGVPHFLPQIGKQGRANRLDLARWLTSPDNPITARVVVNRLWAVCFGEGLSRRIEDLGSQGEWPTHPELLDYLAVELVDSGWDIKHVLRLIVNSGAYRQSSLVSPELRERDPANRLLARQSRFRLDAEMVRDNALAVSGLLVRHLGGPSAKPYQPAGYYAYLNFPVREYEPDKGEGLYRRGLYTWWQRQYLHPSLLAFDAPSREECTAQRNRSNIPQQALSLLNDPSYVEAARTLAARIIRGGGTATNQRIDYAFREALFREPSDEERATLTELYTTHRARYAQDESGARELIDVGDAPVPQDIDPVELAAWASVARVVLNLYETISRY